MVAIKTKIYLNIVLVLTLLIIFTQYSSTTVQASSPLTDINGSFERDSNQNGLPDFWETNWRNGTSTGPSASLEGYDPQDGSRVYRLYNGTGDAGSYQYVLSERIPIMAGQSYQIEASMKYTLQAGGKAYIDLIQLDSNGKEVGYKSQSYQNGGWMWHNNAVSFAAVPNAAYLLIRFAVGGEERAYMDLDKVSFKELDINGSFEKDENQNNLPDFWETNWCNGNSQGPFAKLVPYDPVSGSKVYRLYNGTGDKNSYHYVLSNPIPIVGGRSYELSAMMKYTVQGGGTAGMHLIQLDDQGKEIGYDARSYTNGGWTWHKNTMSFIAKPNTSSVVIRFAVGGEEEAIMDLDAVSFKELDLNGSFEKDENQNNLPDFWETNWRNGNSQGPFAKLVPYDPVSGSKVYRLYNGTGDKNSYHYVLSNPIPIVGGRSYELSAMMKYTVQGGGTAGMHLIQLDDQGKEIGYDARSYTNGGWTWHKNTLSFIAKPNTSSVLIRFAIGGEEEAVMDLDAVSFKELDLNGSFEKDENQNNLPDFWETNWRNGNSQGPFAKLVPYDPVSGSEVYRLYNGTGDKNSYHYVLSNPIPIVGGRSYELSAMMKYTVQGGGTAGMHLIQLDDQGKEIGYDARSYTNGGWTWHKNTMSFIAKPNTSSVVIRFAVGGEEEAIMDLDAVSFKELDINGSFEKDEDQNNLPDFWETNWRNGNSQGPGVSVVESDPVNGRKVLRMNNGVGDPSSYQYTVSNQIPVTGNSSYSIKAFLKFGFPMNQSQNHYSYDKSSRLIKNVAVDGKIQSYQYDKNGNMIKKTVATQDNTKVEMSIIEIDSTNAIVNETHHVFTQGDGNWKENEILLTTRWNTNAITIRFGVGNEEGATVDIDNVRLEQR